MLMSNEFTVCFFKVVFLFELPPRDALGARSDRTDDLSVRLSDRIGHRSGQTEIIGWADRRNWNV